MRERPNSPSLGIRLRPLLVLFPTTGLVLGLALLPLGLAEWSRFVWAPFALPVLLTLLFEIVSSLRRGDFGLDIVAALSMSAAPAFGEELAGVVVAVMYAGGQYLESFAERRARREMTPLLSRVPRTTMRHRGAELEEVKLDAVVPGDRILIRQGDVVSVDGTLASSTAVLDQSALTGESIPVQRNDGEPIMSGVTNFGEAFDLLAARRAAESTYAGIVRLVEAAHRSRAPMSRLADRFAMVFLGLTVVMAGGAWFWTGNPIRAVAVLVIATPCPLILAVPVAIVSGLSRAARHGVLIKGGKALEMIARIRTLVIDKTGTLTDGRARIVRIDAAPGQSPEEVLQAAASLDQASKHVIAQTIVFKAHDQTSPRRTHQRDRNSGRRDRRARGGSKCRIGRSSLRHLEAAPRGRAIYPQAHAVRGCHRRCRDRRKLAAHLVLADELRPGVIDILRSLRRLRVERTVLATSAPIWAWSPGGQSGEVDYVGSIKNLGVSTDCRGWRTIKSPFLRQHIRERPRAGRAMRVLRG